MYPNKFTMCLYKHCIPEQRFSVFTDSFPCLSSFPVSVSLCFSRIVPFLKPIANSQTRLYTRDARINHPATLRRRQKETINILRHLVGAQSHSLFLRPFSRVQIAYIRIAIAIHVQLME